MGCLLTNSLHMLSGACRLYCTAYLRHACASWQPGPAACLFVAAGLDAWHTPNSCLSPACNKCNTCFACCAGHLELQATSMLLQRNLCVYQSGQPVWQIKNHPEVRPVVEGPARPAGLPAGRHFGASQQTISGSRPLPPSALAHRDTQRLYCLSCRAPLCCTSHITTKYTTIQCAIQTIMAAARQSPCAWAARAAAV